MRCSLWLTGVPWITKRVCMFLCVTWDPHLSIQPQTIHTHNQHAHTRGQVRAAAKRLCLGAIGTAEQQASANVHYPPFQSLSVCLCVYVVAGSLGSQPHTHTYTQ